MKSNTIITLSLAVAALASVPAIAAPAACVANNRIQSTSVVDNQTMVVTDTDGKKFTVHMHGACVGLDQSAINLSFRTKTQLGCLSRGDTISYSTPGDNQPPRVRPNLQNPCTIDDVTAGAPAAN